MRYTTPRIPKRRNNTTLHTPLYETLDALPLYGTYLCTSRVYTDRPMRGRIAWMYNRRVVNTVTAIPVEEGLLFIRLY